eukprot:5089340-Amphidinium_carterae.1
MHVNPTKTVVVCDGTWAKQKAWKVWRAGRLSPVKLTTRDLGVDTQWSSWRNPVQHKKRLRTFKQSVKARIVKSFPSVGLYGAEVGEANNEFARKWLAHTAPWYCST